MLFSLLVSPVCIAKSADRAIQKMDSNGDGKLSRKEFRKKKVFNDIDLDNDGFISRQELMIRFGEKTAINGLERPDPVSISAIRRGKFDDVADLKARGLFETGLKPTWPGNIRCPGIDEWYAKDYTPKRPREAYHGGIDIPAKFGTPVIAAMDGEVIAVYEGLKSPRGREVVIRHTPDQSGYPLYLYSRYTHFDESPAVKPGQNVKMGEFIGIIGNSGILGCQTMGKSCLGKSRRPGLHFDILYSEDDRYWDNGSTIVPFNAFWMDPNALYRKTMPIDSVSMKKLPKKEKTVQISYQLESGERLPADTKMIWPFTCTTK